MSAIDQISQDLDWRESELASFKLLLLRPGTTPVQERALLRAAWAMLYAHYEGFCKFCLTIFYDEVQKRVLKCGELPEKTRVLALGNTLRNMRSLPAPDLMRAVEAFTDRDLNLPPSFPEVETNSNLWPSLLSDLLEQADIKSEKIDEHRQKLKTLVSRRNEIAHGKANLISEIAYYLSYESAVYEIMYDLAFLIEDRLTSPPYKVPE